VQNTALVVTPEETAVVETAQTPSLTTTPIDQVLEMQETGPPLKDDGKAWAYELPAIIDPLEQPITAVCTIPDEAVEFILFDEATRTLTVNDKASAGVFSL
jgi:hypothetical protein